MEESTTPTAGTDYSEILSEIAENQLTSEQAETLIEQNNVMIEYDHQILTLVSYIFVLILALFIARIFAKVLSVIDGA